MRTAPILLAMLTVLILMTSCGTARRSAPIMGEREITDPTLRLGKRVFDRECNQCHPGGADGLGPAINNKPLPAFLVRFQVRKGLGVMPSFSDEEISDEELRALSRYVTWLRHQDVNR